MMKTNKKRKVEEVQKVPMYYRIKKIAFSNHAVERWNQRVGPRANKFSLNALLLDLLRLKRIRFVDHDMAVIDENIVFFFTYDGNNSNTMVIQTFIGRITLKPLITKKKYIHNRYVFLDVPASVIVQQKFPSISKFERMQIDETNAQLKFNELSVEEQKVASWKVAYSFKTTKDTSVIPIDLGIKPPRYLLQLNKGSKELNYG